MKKMFLLFFFFFFIENISAKEVNLYFFHGEECPHCAEESEYLDELQKEYNDLKIIKYEVWHNDENAILLQNIKTTLKKENPYVPFTVIGLNSTTGFNEQTKITLKEYIDYCLKEECVDIVKQVEKEGKSIILNNDNKNDIKTTVTVPILGEINAKDVSIPLLSIVIGFIDGFNPCAMWVLIFLISFLLTTKDRRKMWILGSTFLLTSALIYMLFMMSWLTITIKLTNVTIIRNIIALVAVIAGFINLRSFYRMSKKDIGCEVVNDTKRKKTINKIKEVVLEKKMIISILGIIALAVSVNIIELACSAGLPLVYIEVLSLNKVSNVMYFIYILIYCFFFLIDDLIIFIIAMTTFKVTGISNKYTKYSHLIGGGIMLLIGLLLIFKPEIIMFK